MSNDDYETVVSFERFSNFWKFFNKKYDFDDFSTGDSGYKFVFASEVPSREQMHTCVTTSDGYLDTTKFTKIDESCFSNNSFGLIKGTDNTTGFDLDLLYKVNNVDSDLEITITGTAYKGYYNSSKFYELMSINSEGNITYTNELEAINNAFYLDRSNGKFYKYENSSYVEKIGASIPSYLDTTGDLKVKCIFLTKTISGNDFVMCYCRFSSPILMRNSLTIPKLSTFISVGECSQ